MNFPILFPVESVNFEPPLVRETQSEQVIKILLPVRFKFKSYSKALFLKVCSS